MKLSKNILLLAAAYNIIFGFFAVAYPNLVFQILQIPEPVYPALWQCIGMIVGVYGLGYALAWRDPIRHWPIVMVGLLGKVFGPIGFVYAVMFQGFPVSFILVIIFNDLIWWPSFAILLREAYKAHGFKQ